MTSYEYVDGNGSSYSITSDSIEFKPIPAKESSSGMFNAGEPFKIKIEKAQFDFLKQVFEKSINNKIGQTDQRSKGTGKLILLPEKTFYIFEMNSVQKKEIDEVIALISKM
jgi:hypothetical protein